jgi:hypothetical protein
VKEAIGVGIVKEAIGVGIGDAAQDGSVNLAFVYVLIVVFVCVANILIVVFVCVANIVNVVVCRHTRTSVVRLTAVVFAGRKG